MSGSSSLAYSLAGPTALSETSMAVNIPAVGVIELPAGKYQVTVLLEPVTTPPPPPPPGPALSATLTDISLTVTVANGPAGLRDWVALVRPGTSPGDRFNRLDWCYLNGLKTEAPVTGLASATLTFPRPLPGTYDVVLAANDTYNVLVRISVTVPPGVTPPPPPPPPPPAQRKLLGGWRIPQPFSNGHMAIDFATNRLFVTGHAQVQNILEFKLTAMGLGTDPMSWPVLQQTNRYDPFWDRGYPNGLCWWKGKLWVCPRVFYDTAPPPTLKLFALDGEMLSVDFPGGGDQQRFGGFVKRGPGLDPYLGCGGYESGQGTSSGPTAGRLDGTPLIAFDWPASPGVNLEYWNDRAPREPNYTTVGGTDSWVAWQPRTVSGRLEGRWACDRIWGGGLVLPEGICYWVQTGTGDIDYARQNDTFASDDKVFTYLHRYDPVTFKPLGWEKTDLGKIGGQELGPDGKVYLCEAYAWRSGQYVADPVIKVYG